MLLLDRHHIGEFLLLILDRHDIGEFLQANGRYADASLESVEDPLPYYSRHYLELVDWIGRMAREDKKGAGFDKSAWLEGIKLFGRPIFQAIGPAGLKRQAAKANHRSQYRGITACLAVFGST